MSKTYDLDAYRRHAERFGPECVVETAIEDLGVTAAGRLSLWLQRRDRRWRPEIDRVKFASALIEAGAERDRACEMALISSRTLRRREELAQSEPQPRDPTPQAPYSWGKSGQIRGVASTPYPPILSIPGPENGLERAAGIGQLTFGFAPGIEV